MRGVFQKMVAGAGWAAAIVGVPLFVVGVIPFVLPVVLAAVVVVNRRRANVRAKARLVMTERAAAARASAGRLAPASVH